MWSSILIVAMMISSCVPAIANVQEKADKFQWVSQSKDLGMTLSESPDVKAMSDNDNIRIIVEVDEEAVIDRAIDAGVGINQLNASTTEKVTLEVEEAISEVKSDIDKNDLDVQYLEQYANVFSGFSAVTTVEDAKMIEQLPNVKNVYVSREYYLPEPDMATSNEMINSGKAWNLNFKGEGMIVAVLDSSFAPDHQDMQKITDPSRAKYQSESQLPSGLPGKWQSIKMPYAYNYYDKSDVLEAESEHGTHVSGTVGANGDVENGGVRGVAPEAQILGMKVFGNDPNMPSTFSDIYLKAIEDALVLGANAINMSLGSPASFLQTEQEDPARAAIRKAAESGVIVVVSAGNSNRFGNGFNTPYGTDPDKGLVGSPSLNPYTLSVASINNTHIKLTSLDATVTSGSAVSNLTIAYNHVSESPDPIVVSSGHAIDVVYVGTGEPQYYDGKDVAGKFVLAVRTASYYYANIRETAEAKGAAGVIVRGAVGHGDYVNMNVGTTAPSIPMMSLSQNDGNKLRDLLIAGNTVKVNYNGNMISVVSAEKGRMADSTSWGLTPNLDFKPEITAPGDNIFSTYQHGKYGPMSGTSMAAPHVSGATALVMQRIQQDYPELKDIEKYNFAKNILMSTAHPLWVENEATYTSPRRQGAGVMDVYAACVGDVVAVSPETGYSKINLKEIGNDVKFTVEVKNYSNEPVTYEVSSSISTDYLYKGRLLDEPDAIKDAALKCSENTITVPAKGSTTVDVSFDLTNAKLDGEDLLLTKAFPNGNFVEGFVMFKSTVDTQPDISIPYVGFYGKWDKAPIIDDCSKGKSFYGFPGLFIDEREVFYKTSAEDKNIYVSPKDNLGNGDGKFDVVQPILTFLRNAQSFEINILNDKKEVVRTLTKENYITKNHNGNKEETTYTTKNRWIWDGQVNYTVTEGKYYYQLKSKVDYPNAEWQTIDIPVVIDITKPVIKSIDFDKDTKKLVVVAEDSVKLTGYQVQVNDQVLDSVDGNFDLSKVTGDLKELTVLASDAASNIAGDIVVLSDLGDKDAPVLDMPLPSALDYVKDKDVQFKGTIKDDHKLKSLTIAGKAVPFTFDAEKKVNAFDVKLALPEGRQDIKVIAIDSSGNKLEFTRFFFHDSTAPVIKLNGGMGDKVAFNHNKFVLRADFTDNFSGLIVKVNGNIDKIIEADTAYIKTPKDVKYSMNREVELAVGENTFVIEALDFAGNSSKIVYKVVRAGSTSSTGSTSTGYGGSSAPAAGGGSSAPATTVPSTPKQTSTAPVVSNQGGISSVGMTLSAGEVKDMKASLALGQTEMKQIVDNIKSATGNNVEVKLNVANTNANEVKLSIPVTEMKAASTKPVVVTVASNGVVMKLPLSELKPQNANDMLNVTITKAAADGLKLGSGVVGKQSFTMTAAMTSGALAAGQSLPVQIDVTAYNVNKDKTVLVQMNADGTSKVVGNKIVNGQLAAEVGNAGTYVLVERNIDFNDVKAHWSENFVESMASKGIVSGYANGAFNPEKSVTRAEFVTMLVKALDLDLVAQGKSFKDVSSNDWANQFVETAYANGIVKGAEGKFNPNANITRAEMAVMIANAMKISSNDTAKAAGTPDWAAGSIAAVMNDGLMTGSGDQFRPNDLANRAESATVIYKVFNQEAK